MFCRCQPPPDDDHHFDPLQTPKEKLIKIAIIGPSSSGKTTIIKQLKQISESIDEADIKNMTSYIKERIVFNMKILCQESMVLSSQFDHKTSVNKSIAYLRDEMLSLRESHELTQDIAYKIRELFDDEGIKHTLKQTHCFQIDENANYFFNKIRQIVHEEYIPDFEDYLRITRRSSGYSHTQFMQYIPGFGEYYFAIPDVGGARTERKKWWNHRLLCDPELDAIVYIVPIADYNLTLFEDDTSNRLIEAIEVFKDTMMKGEFFENKAVFLLFNKYDVFLEKIKTIPMTHCFDDFDGNPNDADEALRFIAQKFMHILSENAQLKEPLRIRRINALNTENVQNVFSKIITEIIEQRHIVSESFPDSDSSTY